MNGKPVYVIDGIRTIVASVKGDIARGAILREDLSIKECFIARSGGFFAHGETAREALADAVSKSLRNEPIESRIERFIVNKALGLRATGIEINEDYCKAAVLRLSQGNLFGNDMCEVRQ